MALGASTAQVQRQVLRSTMRLAMAGVVFGTVIALIAGKVTASLLFATTPWHFPTYLGMALAIVLVAAVSGYIPARRASRINPMEALRNN